MTLSESPGLSGTDRGAPPTPPPNQTSVFCVTLRAGDVARHNLIPVKVTTSCHSAASCQLGDESPPTSARLRLTSGNERFIRITERPLPFLVSQQAQQASKMSRLNRARLNLRNRCVFLTEEQLKCKTLS